MAFQLLADYIQGQSTQSLKQVFFHLWMVLTVRMLSFISDEFWVFHDPPMSPSDASPNKSQAPQGQDPVPKALVWLHQASEYARDCPGCSTRGPTSQETLQSQELWIPEPDRSADSSRQNFRSSKVGRS